MANTIETAVLEMTQALSEQQGVYVVDVEYKKENSDRFLRIYIDKPGGVGLQDCEAFSRAAEVLLDEADLISEAYCLEVSSPGADRKLKTDREFSYYIGREVEVKLYKAIDGKKEFVAILEDYRDKTAILSFDGTTVEVSPKEAVYIRLNFVM